MPTKYVIKVSDGNGHSYDVMDKEARGLIAAETTARENAVADLKSTLNALHIGSRSTKTTLFNVSSVDGSTSNTVVYTVETVQRGSFYGFTDYENDGTHPLYTLAYSAGSGNVGTSPISYRFDDTIESDELTTGVIACFVCDRSDYTLKIIPHTALTSNHRIIAMFYGLGMTLINNIITFGNDCLFNIPQRGFRKLYIVNFGQSNAGALTLSVSNNVYTLTKNAAFSAFGVDESSGKQVGIGSSGIAGVTYPFPDTVTSGVINGYACIVCSPDDTTTSTWKIISIGELNNNINSYLVLGFIYDSYSMFFTTQAEMLFTNYFNQPHLTSQYIAKDAFWYTHLSNSIFLASGSVTYNPSAHTVTIANPIMAPDIDGCGFIANYNSQSFVIDFSEDAHPDYLKYIYWNNYTNEFVCFSSDTDSATRLYVQKNKNAFSLLCAVYNGAYIYTSSCKVGIWFIGDTDIYKSTADHGNDLYKAFRKVGVIGDSLSVGYMMNKDTGVATGRMLEYSWPKVVMRDADMPWLNIGTSGQNVLTWCSNATYGKVQAEASGNKCQAYIIGLGENDCSNSERGIPLGTPSDIVDDYTQVATTYYGGYARIIQILKHLNPGCKIFCLTNPRSGTARANYNVAVRYIANTYYSEDDSVILVDIANNYSSEFNSGFLPADSSAITGGHYSAIGYARIATILEQAISNIMEANDQTMYNIPYIPYDTGDPTPNTMTE